jgi:hypothetical protein
MEETMIQPATSKLPSTANRASNRFFKTSSGLVWRDHLIPKTFRNQGL